MASSELFIMADPRFLSGGARRNCPLTCDAPMTTLRPGEATVTSKDLLEECGNQGAAAAIAIGPQLRSRFGQCVHYGRDSYHRHEYHPSDSNAAPGFNVFCRPEDLPTAGVELETYCRSDRTVDRMRKELVSNWFHFEEDGSLNRLVGHELITEVLPPRVYRDIRTWTGLQNCISPWLESWNRADTGLHVHVGVSQFDKCDGLPCLTKPDRRLLGKWAIAFVYSEIVGYPLGDRVFLRKNGTYCEPMNEKKFLAMARQARKGELSAGGMFDMLLSAFANDSAVISVLETLRMGDRTAVKAAAGLRNLASFASIPHDMSGHHVELNFQHSETVEFRRGKGTTNAVSVHRMVEFCTLLVRYVWKAAREPGMTVSPESAYGFIIENTTSEALRKTAERVWSSMKGN